MSSVLKLEKLPLTNVTFVDRKPHNSGLLIFISVVVTATFLCAPLVLSQKVLPYETEEFELREKRDSPDSGTRRLPQAIIIGAKKSGTRALLEFLRLNSKIKGPGPEVHFFDRHFDRGFDWYRSQMPPTSVDQLTIEKTPSYLVTKTVPYRVYKMNPKIKIIVVVRDPITRAISDYTQTSSKRPGMPDFQNMAFNQQTGKVNTSWGAIKIGLYHRHIKRWLQYFPRNQIHFVDGENLIAKPAKEVQKVEHFLGLASEVHSSDFEFNAEKGFPCIVKWQENIQNINKFYLQKKIHCLGRTKGRTHPNINSNFIDRLRAFYLLENDKFFRLIGRKFRW